MHIPTINVSTTQIPKPFKTMPSPTRPSSTANCLKEIFEECDAGSSDNNSNTNTPRAILRSQANSTHHRRTKFHKSRTTSGSSTDGSDDDAEKKRPTKIIDSAIAKQFTQRRDSHDDSSDSQDPGTTCSGNSNAGSSLILRNGSKSTNNKTSTDSGGRDDHRGKTTTNSSEIGYRKHRTGRRRQTETRLRESQSLNRITEVQECEHNNSNNNNSEKVAEATKVTGDDIKNKVATLNHLNSCIVNATNELKANKNQNNSKAKGFSARFLQNFKRNQEAPKTQHKSNRNSMPEVPLLKVNNGKVTNTLKTPAPMPNDGSDRSKKIKILGRYFQVT